MDDERAVQQVLARYVRAADHRDKTAMAQLRRFDGAWKIVHHQIVLDQPMAFPGA